MDITQFQNGHQIDWQAVWRQLDWDESNNQERAIQERLRQRAKQYAAPIQRAASSGEIYTLLTFELGAETYGMDVMKIYGVRTVGKITRVPGAPLYFRGVVNVRGQIVTVLDLRYFFNLTNETPFEPDEMILVRENGLEIGLLADHIAGVVSLSKTAIEPIEMQYALGVTSDKLVALNIEQLFADERLIVGGAQE